LNNKAERVSLKVYNVQDREVAKLVNDYKSAGMHIITFNAQNLVRGCISSGWKREFSFYTETATDKIVLEVTFQSSSTQSPHIW